MKSTIVRLALIGLAFGSAAAYADGIDRDSTSKENPIFEGQGNLGVVIEKIGEVGATLKDWWSAGMLNDGSIQFGYNVLTTDAATSGNIDVSIETRIFGVNMSRRSWKCDQPTPCDAEMLIMPIEFRVRTNLETGKAELKDARGALARVVLNSIGLTAQAFSIVYKNFDLEQGDNFGMEVVALSLNEAVAIPGTDGRLELLIKGTGTFGFGGISAKNQAVTAAAAAKDANIRYAGGAYYSASGSVGLRVAKRVIFELYSGIYQIDGSIATKDDHGDLLPPTIVRAVDFKNTYFGVAARARVTDWLYLKGSVQKDSYSTDIGMEGGATAADTLKAESANITLEVRW